MRCFGATRDVAIGLSPVGHVANLVHDHCTNILGTLSQRNLRVHSYGKGSAMKPPVSILISACDAKEWTGERLQSAFPQTWLRKEIIVVDDESTVLFGS
jgi:hypothetical protein